MDRKYQIFISSTYTDLIKEREKVRDAILRMYHFPVGMELFSAGDEEQWEIITETIDTSDYYVLLVGSRYGTVTDDGISYTEKEFHYAKEKGIPILAFIMDESVPVLPENVEKKHIKEFKAFKKSVMTGRTIEKWLNPDDLAAKVTAALHKQMDRKKRPGWVRGDTIDVETTLHEMSELNRRNRELEEENKKLKESIMDRKPSLSINLYHYGTRDRPVETGIELDKITLKSIDSSGDMGIPTPLLRRTVQDVPYISSQDIKDYNSKLPSKEVIIKYNEQVREFRTFVENGYHIKGEIINDGTCKAFDVNISIDFPEEFKIVKWKDVERKNPPKRPRMPVNPYKIANSMTMDDTLENAFSLMEFENQDEYYGGSKYQVKEDLLSLMMDSGQANHGVSVEGNRVTLWADDLLHKASVMSGDFCIIPSRRGTFKAMVSLMCEEYVEPQEKEIIITVE